MPLSCGFLVPVQCNIQVGFDAAAHFIGLTHVELRVGISFDRRIAPLLDSGFIFALAPCVDARLDVGQGGRHGQ